MYFTVEQALSVYPLSEAKLVAGFDGKHRIVRAVNVMDAPDIPDWIKEGEMVFTTAYLVKDRPEEASRLLARLNERRSSGLGIKLGRFWDAIPEALIEQADELGFPLIELPYQFTFSDQMNGLFREEMRRSNGLLHETLEKQIRLMRFALQADPNRRLFDSVTEVVGHPVAVVGSHGQVVYNSSEVPDEAILARRPWPSRAQWMRGDGWQAYRIPLMKQADCSGFAFFFSPQPFLSTVEESLYFQAAELMAFHLNFRYEDYFETSAQLDFGQLVRRHLKNGLPADSLTDYAVRWESELFVAPYRCVLTDVARVDDAVTRDELLVRLKKELAGHSLMQRLKGLHLVLEEGVLSLMPEPDGDAGHAVEAAFGAFLADFLNGKHDLKAAIGSRKSGALLLKTAFGECAETLRLAGEWGMSERIVRYETLDLAFVFERVPPERMRVFCDRWLGGLLSRDPEYVQVMLRTLETYLECDGQLNETAKRLFIHRNTATYRIEKLGEVLDVDFKKVNDLLRLKLAFLFRRLLRLD